MKLAIKTLIAGVLAGGAVAAQAAIVNIGAADFVFSAGQITFSEAAIGTRNPSFAVTGSLTVGFGSLFTGQSFGAVGTDCPTDTAAQGCVIGLPAGPSLALDGTTGGTRISEDGVHPGSPVLSGTPFLNGSIAMLFSTDQAGITLDGGFFNAIGSTRVSAYGRDGSLLGFITNTATGVETLRLGTDDGASLIAGLLISLVAPEEAGFSIDNIRFGAVRADVPDRPDPPGGQVPEPGSLALAGLALLGLAAARRRRTGA